MRARAVERLRLRAIGAAWLLGALATACGRIGYDPELDVYGPKPDANGDDARSETPDARPGDDAVSEVAPEATSDRSIEDSAVLDATPESAGDASPDDAGSVCPRSFDVTSPASTPLRGGSSGIEGTDSCPVGQVVIGFDGITGTNDIITMIQALCGRLAPIATVTSCQVAPTIGATLSMHGDPLASGRTWTMTCPAGQVVAGIRGRAMGALDQLAIDCAPLAVSKTGGTFRVSVGGRSASSAQGGSGGLPFADPCPTDQIASGIHFRSGAWIDAFAVFCAQVTAIP